MTITSASATSTATASFPSASLHQQPPQSLLPVLEEDGRSAAVSAWNQHSGSNSRFEGQDGPSCSAHESPSRSQQDQRHFVQNATSVRYSDQEPDDSPLDQSFNATGGGYADDLAFDDGADDGL